MISFCCPSRGRPTLAKRLVDTATETQQGETEFLFYLNDDDPTLEQYKDLLDEKHYTVGPNQSTCYSWNLMAKKAKNDIVMLMGDDVQVQTQGWDSIIANEFNRYEDRILMVVPSDGRLKGTGRIDIEDPTLWPDKPLPAAHFAVHKNWINTLGYLAPPFFGTGTLIRTHRKLHVSWVDASICQLLYSRQKKYLMARVSRCVHT